MVTLTGTFTRLDGTPATGTVRVTPSRSPIMDPDGKIVISGPQTFPLDKDGTLSVPIPASNDPDLGPPFTYAIDVNLTHANWKISKVWIPHGSTTVDLSEIADYTPTPGVATRVVTIPADGTDGQVLVWDGAGFSWDFPPEGPQGPPGEVTTADLTAALAGKVTGTGMTLRHDTSVGTRVFLDHPGGSVMLHGDTGWRDLRASNGHATVNNDGSNAITWNRFWVRRVGSQVFLSMSFVLATEASRLNNSLVADSVAGFRARPEDDYIPIYNGPSLDGLAGRTNGWTGGRLSGRVFFVNGSYVTHDSWPTTLPGLPG